MTNVQFEEVIIKETGEIRKQWVMDNPEEYTVIHNDALAKKDAYKKEKPYHTKFNTLSGGFTFTMITTLKNLIADTTFTQAEKTRIMFLGTYISYDKENNYLTYSNGKPVLKNQLMEMLEMTNRKEFYAFYNKLVEVGVITEEVVNRSIIKLLWSNKYHFKGKTTTGAGASDNMVKTYDNQIRELYTEKNAKGKAVHTAHSLFTIFTIMPYVHPVSNSLCKFPDKPCHASEPFTLQELAEVYGYTRTNDLKRMLFRIKLHKMPVVAVSETSEGTRLFINPFVVNRTGKTPNATLFTMFDSSFNVLAERKGWSETEKQDFLKQQ